MRLLVRESVVPWLASQNPEERFASRVFSVFGLSESGLDELLVGVVRPDEARLAFRAAFPRLQARVTVRGAPGDDLEARLDALEERVRERLGHHVYATGDEGMEETVGKLLREHRRTLAVAESCTGGLIGHRITEVPGSSSYFLLGVVTYSNEAKQQLLAVSPQTLSAHGAVSTRTAEEMAAGCVASPAQTWAWRQMAAGPCVASPARTWAWRPPAWLPRRRIWRRNTGQASPAPSASPSRGKNLAAYGPTATPWGPAHATGSRG